jgi:putative MFS transporter
MRSLPRYPLVLFTLLCTAMAFEGFDMALASLLLPLLSAEFEAGPDVLGLTLSWIGLGTVAAFALVQLADRAGRRPILLVSLGGYAALTLATYFSPSLAFFGAVQFGARMLIVTQIAMAYVILSEELPTDLRGRSNALMGACGSIGAAIPAVFLAPLEQTAVGWRGLFLIGALPLLLLPVFHRVVREPPVFVARRAEGADARFLRHAGALLSRPLRRRFAGVTLVYFVVNFWSVTTFAFFTLYAVGERGWALEDLQVVIPVAVPFAFAGYFAGGWLMDRVGRRIAACTFLALGTLVTVLCFQATDWYVVAAAWIGFQMLQGIWAIVNTMAVELFPTQMRAAANGLAHNLLGRWGIVVGPAIAGALATFLDSTGDAISLLAVVNLLALPVILLVLPETRGVALDEVPHEHASP